MGPGDKVDGRFRLERLAAEGGMGAVYRALDLERDVLTAVKLLRGVDAQSIERFTREARVLAELRHPGIVEYVAHGRTASGELYLAMEWLEGEDLHHRLASRELTLGESMRLLSQAAAALAAAHARKIVHRDIKPSNLFLVDYRVDQLKVVDFGVARLASLEALTQSGAVLGTPRYMAPEQARGSKAVDARADVFALGGVLFRCLTGRAAFPGETPAEVIARILDAPTPRVRDLRPEVPRDVDELIARMLAKDPDDRPADCSEVAAAALKFDLTPPAAATPRLSVPTLRAARRNRRRAPFWLAGGLVAAGAAAGGWWLTHRMTEPAAPPPPPPPALVVAPPPPPPAPALTADEEALEHIRRLEPATAQKLLEHAIAGDPHAARPRVVLALAMYELGQKQRARDELALARAGAAEFAPDERELLIALDDLAAGNQSAGIDRLQGLQERSPTVELSYLLVEELLAAERVSTAEAVLDSTCNWSQALADHPLVGLLRARVVARRSNWDAAIDAATRAGQAAEARGYPVLAAVCRLEVARALLQRGAFDAVIDTVDEARTALLPTAERSWLTATSSVLAMALSHRGDYRRALRVADEAIEVARQTNSDSFTPRLDRATYLFLAGRHADGRAAAEEVYRTALPAEKAWAEMVLGWERAHAGDIAAAGPRLAQAREHGPRDHWRFSGLLTILRGEVLIRRGSFAEARKVIDEGALVAATRFQAVAGVTRYLLAWLSLEEGRPAEAELLALQARDDIDRMSMRDYQVLVRLLLARIADERGRAADAGAFRSDAANKAEASEDPAVRIAARLAIARAAKDAAVLPALADEAAAAGLEGTALEVDVAIGELEGAAGRKRLQSDALRAEKLGQILLARRIRRSP